jgi:hypothetical protein
MRVARVLAVLTAVGTAAYMLTGLMTDPMFYVPDTVLTVLLLVGAVLPVARGARGTLLMANGFALGVFSVAASGMVIASGTVGIGVLAGIVACAVSLGLLARAQP